MASEMRTSNSRPTTIPKVFAMVAKLRTARRDEFLGHQYLATLTRHPLKASKVGQESPA